jgi:ribosome maturation factor RimP
LYIWGDSKWAKPTFLLPDVHHSPAVSHAPSRLESEIRQLFEDEGIMLLEFNASGHAGRLQLRAVGDRRFGSLTINDCVSLTRQIQHLIQEKRLLDEDFRLEVSSPGLDYPLREGWQFAKNVGRLLKVQIPGEKGPREISGRLTAFTEDGLVLADGKTEWNLKFTELLSARILPEFKPPRLES